MYVKLEEEPDVTEEAFKSIVAGAHTADGSVIVTLGKELTTITAFDDTVVPFKSVTSQV